MSFFGLINNRWVKTIIGSIACILYYVFIPDYTVHDYPNQIFRALFGMMIGAIVFYLSSSLNKDKVVKPIKFILTIVFIVAYLAPIYMSYENYFYRYTYLICFTVWIFIVVANLSLIGPLYSRIGEFLGALSMPIFIWHQVVICFLTDIIVIKNDVFKLVMCYLITFLISLLNMFIVKGFTNWIEKRKEIKKTI